MHCFIKHLLDPDPCLKINSSEIPVVNETKFLGLIFDRKLSFKPHIAYLKKKCLKANEPVTRCGQHILGSRQHYPSSPLPLNNPIEIRLRVHCILISSILLHQKLGQGAECYPSSVFGSIPNNTSIEPARGGQ
jgi:hypothetical protein